METRMLPKRACLRGGSLSQGVYSSVDKTFIKAKQNKITAKDMFLKSNNGTTEEWMINTS